MAQGTFNMFEIVFHADPKTAGEFDRFTPHANECHRFQQETL
jgi:hypothetical protein